MKTGASDDASVNQAFVTDRHLLTDVLGDHPKTKILAAVVGNPDNAFSTEEIAETAAIDASVAGECLETLHCWGLVTELSTDGNCRYTLNTESDAAEAFASFEWQLMKHLAQKEEVGELEEDSLPLPPGDE